MRRHICAFIKVERSYTDSLLAQVLGIRAKGLTKVIHDGIGHCGKGERADGQSKFFFIMIQNSQGHVARTATRRRRHCCELHSASSNPYTSRLSSRIFQNPFAQVARLSCRSRFPLGSHMLSNEYTLATKSTSPTR